METLLISLIGLCSIGVNTVQAAYTVSGVDSLFSVLRSGNTINNRPTDLVNVSVTLTLDSINFLDFDKRTFSAEGWITSSWEDQRWTWTPASYGDIEYLFITKTDCWKPNIIIDNEVSNKNVLNDDNLVMRAKHDSPVTWEQPVLFNTYCHLDATNFPFDKQECHISIGTVGYDATTVLLTHGGSDVITSSLEDNAEWSVESTSLSTRDRTDSSGQLTSTQLLFNFELKRHALWYVIHILLPLTVTSLLGLGVFLIPAESGEKVAYTSSILVVNAILSWISSYFIPTSSVSAPILGIYVVVNLLLNGIEIILTIVSIRLQNKHAQFEVVPMATQVLVRQITSGSCFHGDDDSQTREIIDLTSEVKEKRKSHTLKAKFSMKSQNQVGPSPMPTSGGYQRMSNGGSDFNPSVDPEMDGRINRPASNSRYRPSSYTHMRPISSVQTRPSSYTHMRPISSVQTRPSSYTHMRPISSVQTRPSSYTHSSVRPMSMKSVGGIQIREQSFVNDDLSMSYPTGLNITGDNNEYTTGFTPQPNHQTEFGTTREPAANCDVTNNTGDVINTANELKPLERKVSEKSVKKTTSKTRSSFRSNRERDVTWAEISRVFDIVCFIVMLIVVVVHIVVVMVIFQTS